MAVVNEAVEAVAEQVAEEALEVADLARTFSGRDFGIGLFVGVGVGIVGGGYYISKRLRIQYAQIAEDEIAEMREHYRKKELARDDRLSKKQELKALVEEAGYKPPSDEDLAEAVADRVVGPPIPEPETKNIFADQAEYTDDWDFEVELRNRGAGKPYVIHYDEQHERDYSESTFTYYAGDDVLCDERDKIVDARDEIIGDENLDKFGHGSNDPLIVYVRNDELSAEFEIVKSDKTYAEEVHGLSHGDYPRQRRRPFDDE